MASRNRSSQKSPSSTENPQTEASEATSTVAPLTDGPKTLNGLILEHFEDIPEAGIGLNIAGYPMEIIQTKNRVVKTVKIFPALTATELKS